MRLAIQEDMLPGKTTLERFETAKSFGFQGVEVWGSGLTARVPELVEAIQKTGMLISAVNHGPQRHLIDPDRPGREKALAELRQSVVDGVDLGATGVILAPHFGEPLMPDLTPYKSQVQLEYEMLHNHLRTLSDYVYAIGIDLYIEPINKGETHFINTIADAIRVRRKIKDHPHIKIAADLYHMASEETDVPQVLRDNIADLGYIHLCDNNRQLPGQGTTDFAAIGAVLKELGYDGWITFECGHPGENAPQAAQFASALPATLDMLRHIGIP